MGFPKNRYKVEPFQPGVEMSRIEFNGGFSLNIEMGEFSGLRDVVRLEFPNNGIIPESQLSAMGEKRANYRGRSWWSDSTKVTGEMIHQDLIRAIDFYCIGRHRMLILVRFHKGRSYGAFFRGNNLDQWLVDCSSVPMDELLRFESMTDKEVFDLFGGKD